MRSGQQWRGRRLSALRPRPRTRTALDDQIDRRLLNLLVEQNVTGTYPTTIAVVFMLLFAPTLPIVGWVILFALLRAANLAHNLYFALRLRAGIEGGTAPPGLVWHMVASNGFAAFSWGAMTWPLVIGASIDFATVLFIVCILFAVVLTVLSAACHRRARLAALLGALAGLGPKIVALAPQVGAPLVIGSLVFFLTTVAYAALIGRQVRGGVLLHMRNQRNGARLARSNAALAESLAHANWLADRDSLTKLRNRRAFEAALRGQWDQFAHRRVCLVLIDIDHFKRINDTFGHDMGDGVLVAVGTVLRQWERAATGRLAGRWGGEEFIVAAALRPADQPGALAEDLRERIAALSHNLPWPGDMQLSASLGCAALDDMAGLDGTIARADRALYAAKSAGRNRWMIAA